MKIKLCWSAAIFLFCLLYFIPSKVGGRHWSRPFKQVY